MMNQSTNKGVTPRIFDFSHGSTNRYEINARHNLIPTCLVCGARSIITLDGSEYFAYFVRGQNITTAFPTLTADQREVLITGTHPDCWDAMTKEDDDD